MIFNRSHYEDVLVVRVHKLAPRSVRSKYYGLINDFEKLLERNGARTLKFYLHIGPDEQLERFKQRLDDPARNWKISESDYAERELWPQYVEAYEEALARTSAKHAHGASSPPTTNGSATSRCRRSSPKQWRKWD